MCPEDTNGKIIEPPIGVECKVDTSSGANVMPIYVFRKLCPAIFDFSDKALRSLMQIGPPQWHMETVRPGSLGYK